MQIDTICQTECSPALLSLMQQVICHAVKDETGSDSFELSLTVTNDDAIRELNRTYRNIDRSTDVLSFPLVDFDGYEDAMQDFEDPEYIDPETGAVALGDIVLSLEHAQQQAAEFGHSLERETCYFCVHSVLHLLGYDHIDPQDQALMRQREEEILHAFDLSRKS